MFFSNGEVVPFTDHGYPATAVILLAQRLNSAGSLWVIGGSSGLAMRGADLGRPPRDLDIYADEEDVPLLHARLADLALDEPERDETGRYRSILSHYDAGGTVVELVGAFQVRSGDSEYRTEVRRLLHPLGESFKAGEMEVRLVPLGHELIFNVMRERPDRCRIIGEMIRSDPGRHLPALKRIVSCNKLSAETVRQVRQYVPGLTEVED
jgi:hypothetical protein